MNLPLIHADEADLFLGELDGVSDPETKRKIIGRLFIDVFQKHADQIDGAANFWPKARCTRMSSNPCRSAADHPSRSNRTTMSAAAGKDGAETGRAAARVVQGRSARIGARAGPSAQLYRAPPVSRPRSCDSVPRRNHTPKLEILREADAVYIDQIRKHGLYDDIWQAFVAILPVRTVGVMGDGRTYDYACALRAVTSVDGMTADYYPFTHEFLGETATRIINEVPGINRVTYDITSKPPGTIEWE